MKKILMAFVVVSTLAAAGPAMADRGQNFDNRIDNLQDEIQRGIRQGTISRNEAQPLRERLRQLTRLERQYSRGGFTRSEQRDLQQRIQTLRHQINYAQLENGRRGHRGGR